MISMFLTKQTMILFLGAFLVFSGLYTTVFANEPTNSDFDTAIELEGYAWSPNIGWISFNCKQPTYGTDDCGTSDYKVRIRQDNKGNKISGYAWSSNVGWIQFGNPGGGPNETSGCPSGSCAARLNKTTSEFSGWARALNYGSGWDGWLSLNCLNTSGGCTSSNYRITATPSGGFGSNSYAWSTNVIGWTNFSLVTFTPPCSSASSCTSDWSGIVTTNIWCEQTTSVCADINPTYQCSGVPPSCGAISISGDLVVTPLLVRDGGTVDVSWSGVTGGATCEVRSSDGNGPYANGDRSSNITFNTTEFTLYCVPRGGGPEVEVDTKTVKKIPTIFES